MPELGSDGFEDQPGSFGSPPENPLDNYDEGDQDPDENAEEVDITSEQEEALEKMAGGPNVDSLEEFADTYRISEGDAGYTPQEILKELREGEEREPNELDEEILDSLLMNGYYEREFSILSDKNFKLRTIDSQCSHNAVLVMREISGVDDNGMITTSMDNTMLVAQHLSEFMGEPTCDKNQFHRKPEIEKRFRKASEMATPILDAIGSRINAFRQRVNDATNRSIANF
jgi:hypothetical protein